MAPLSNVGASKHQQHSVTVDIQNRRWLKNVKTARWLYIFMIWSKQLLIHICTQQFMSETKCSICHELCSPNCFGAVFKFHFLTVSFQIVLSLFFIQLMAHFSLLTAEALTVHCSKTNISLTSSPCRLCGSITMAHSVLLCSWKKNN